VLVIRWGDLRLRAALRDTPTARAVWDALPIEARARRWGDEVYFELPADAPLEATVEDDASQVVPAGSLCLWCEAAIVAVPFGPTPISLANECRLAAAVNVFGAVEGEARALAAVAPGDALRLERAP
jgi:hypothetical protein